MARPPDTEQNFTLEHNSDQLLYFIVMAEMSFLDSPLTSQLKLADDTHGKDGLLQLAYIALSGKCSWGRSLCHEIAITGLTVVADCRHR